MCLTLEDVDPETFKEERAVFESGSVGKACCSHVHKLNFTFVDLSFSYMEVFEFYRLMNLMWMLCPNTHMEKETSLENIGE